MRKIALFVEGQTELIMVREFLLRRYNYEVNLECLELFREGTFRPIEYEFKNPNANVFYQIIKVGNDQKVTSMIIEREKSFFENGFEKIIGLRDMYSRVYREMQEDGIVNTTLNSNFISESKAVVKLRCQNYSNIFICFSIMEVEAWFLALYKILERVNPALTKDFINEKLNLDLSKINPETYFFNPAKALCDIYDLIGLVYDKRKGDIEKICHQITQEDFYELYTSSICGSFNYFYEKVA